MIDTLNGYPGNRARGYMKLIGRFFFEGEKLTEVPRMSKDERKEFMLKRLDEMFTAKFEAIEKDDYSDIVHSKDDANVYDSFAKFLNEQVLTVDNMRSFIWKDSWKKIPNPDCPLWDKELYAELTEDEKIQVEMITETFSLLKSMERGKMVEPARFMPGVDEPIMKADVPGFRQFNFDNPVIRDFIENTPYRNVAAEVVHIVMWMFSDAVEDMMKRGIRKDECKKIFDVFNTEDIDPYLAFAAAVINSHQYIVRARSVFSLLCNEYQMLDVLADYDKIK